MTLAKPVPPIRNGIVLNRGLPVSTAVSWLKAGWSDFKSSNMEASLLFGILVFTISWLLIAGIFAFDLDYILFPLLGAFMVLGPAMAVGLYEKSRNIEDGESTGIGRMLFVKPRSRGQIAFVGLVLSLWILLWLRAAVLLYALFFGMHEFPGVDGVVSTLLTEPRGWWLLLTGTLFGGLFAAFAFGISTFSIPMLLVEETDAFTSMGSSLALSWHNLPVMVAWGAIVSALFVVSILTGLLGLIVIFPVLGHATWHVYRAVRGNANTAIFSPAMPGHD